MMSHGAIVAREYGIPAVVGLMDATTRLATGQTSGGGRQPGAGGDNFGGARRRHNMTKLTYSMLVSLDGFVATYDRKIDWIPMDEELHRFFNQQARDCAVSLYGRQLYEVMRFWETVDTNPSAADYEVEFARIWQATPKIVFSKTLTEVGPNATLARDLIPEEIIEPKEQSKGDIEVGGPTLAAHFIRLGLVDEFHLSVCPVVLGGGTPFFPPLDKPINLRLVERRGFRTGVTYLRYAVAESH